MNIKFDHSFKIYDLQVFMYKHMIYSVYTELEMTVNHWLFSNQLCSFNQA